MLPFDTILTVLRSLLHYRSQKLSPDASFVREKSRSSQRLNQNDHKHKRGKGEDKVDHKIPVTEALFLPHFPLRGEIEDHDFEVRMGTRVAKEQEGIVVDDQRCS